MWHACVLHQGLPPAFLCRPELGVALPLGPTSALPPGPNSALQGATKHGETDWSAVVFAWLRAQFPANHTTVNRCAWRTRLSVWLRALGLLPVPGAPVALALLHPSPGACAPAASPPRAWCPGVLSPCRIRTCALPAAPRRAALCRARHRRT